MSHPKNVQQKKGGKGFTLVETLIAIAVLSLAVTGPMTIAQKSISSAIYARDRVMASYLAQDAVEYVRNARDTNRLNSSAGWLDYLDDCRATECIINTNLPVTEADAIYVASPSNERMYFDNDSINGTYLYSHQNIQGSVPTPFIRRVEVIERIPNREADVIATVSWQPNAFSVPKSFTATARLFNFKP